jgi:hypothetical protein
MDINSCSLSTVIRLFAQLNLKMGSPRNIRLISYLTSNVVDDLEIDPLLLYCD